MADVVYVSRVRVERRGGPNRAAYLPADSSPTLYGTHGEVAAHYNRQPGTFDPRATTLDHIVGAAAG